MLGLIDIIEIMEKDKKVGLALGSGGGRGFAHIGVIKSLVKNKIPIDFIAGSSIGAIVGGLYAATGDIEEVEKIANSISFKNFLKSLLKRSPHGSNLWDKKFNLFFKKIIGDIKIEELKIPFCAVGSNLLTGKIVKMSSGSLITAMEASSAIPLVVSPVKIDDDYIFDGGMISPIPIEVVKEMGADVTIGVSLYGNIFPIQLKRNKRMSKLKAGTLSRFLALKRLSEIDLEKSDIDLEIKIPGEDYGIFRKFFNNHKLIDCGFETTEEMIKEIKAKL